MRRLPTLQRRPEYAEEGQHPVAQRAHRTPHTVTLRTFLDEGVPASVGEVLTAGGHVVILHRQVLPEGARDEVVCATALANHAILVAVDGDMKRIAKKYGMTPAGDRFAALSIIRLCCNEVLASKRLQ